MAVRSSLRFSSVKIAIAFAIWSTVWILVSDAILHMAINAPVQVWRDESIKGLVYVLITAPMLYFFMRAREQEELEAHRLTEVRLRRLFESNLLAICYWQETGEITDANDAFLRLVGYTREQLRSGSLRWTTITPEEWSAQDSLILKRLKEGEKHVTFEKEYLRRDNTRVPVIVGASLLGTPPGSGIAYALDASELRDSQRRNAELEEQLRQNQKLEAVGQLASGLAHDLNNLLSVVLGHAVIINARLEPTDPSRENTAQIQAACESANRMIRSLLAFGRKQQLKSELLDMNAIVHDLSKLVQGALGSAIRLSLKLSPQLWSVRADRGQLEQAFLNLVVNARDAMPMGGTLTISTANSRDGTGVLIRFTDTGVGMSAGTKARIFDPFFTTKAAGKGSGLGLSTVHGIIGQSGGKISVKSEPGHGAEFEIFLPRAEQIPAKPPKSAAANMEADAGTILLVEDQADLRAVLSRFLQDSEYRVLEAKDGDQAIRIANRFPTRIDVMVTDIVMPGLSGYDIAQKIREIRPGTKVVYLTGYLDAKKQLHRLQSDERLLEKPVHPEKLLASVREMIAA